MSVRTSGTQQLETVKIKGYRRWQTLSSKQVLTRGRVLSKTKQKTHRKRDDAYMNGRYGVVLIEHLLSLM